MSKARDTAGSRIGRTVGEIVAVSTGGGPTTGAGPVAVASHREDRVRTPACPPGRTGRRSGVQPFATLPAGLRSLLTATSAARAMTAAKSSPRILAEKRMAASIWALR